MNKTVQTNEQNSLKIQSKHQNPDSGMAEILELSDWEFKITMISMPRALK